MITITKDMIESMYYNSTDFSVTTNDYDCNANSRVMSDNIDGKLLTILIYSHFTDFKVIRKEIRNGNINVRSIWWSASYIDLDYGNGHFEVNCEGEYVLDEEAEDLLEKLHSMFSLETQNYIEQEIEALLN